MYKHFLAFTLILPSLAMAGSDPCEIIELKLDRVEIAHKQNASLKDVLPLVGIHRGIVKQSWEWLEKGGTQYTAWRIGQKAGCEALNQGVYYY